MSLGTCKFLSLSNPAFFYHIAIYHECTKGKLYLVLFHLSVLEGHTPIPPQWEGSLYCLARKSWVVSWLYYLYFCDFCGEEKLNLVGAV